MKFEGKHFIVTGGSNGLGAATVEALVAKGACVTVFDINRAGCEELVKKHGETGAKMIKFIECDVTVEAQIDAALAQLELPLHGLINCAGEALAMRTVHYETGAAHSMAEFQRMVNLNLVGTFAMASKCAVLMERNEIPEGEEERGVIINVASIAAFEAQSGQCAYAAAKGGVVALTIPMCRDLAPMQIRVNCISPGIFDTAIAAKLSDDVSMRVQQSQAFPCKRFGKPDEFAHTVVYMVENTYVNGETLKIDAGLHYPQR